jgi:hypothetical protein
VVAVRLSISHPQSSLYIPASAKSSKRTAKNSRSFRTPSRYPQKTKEILKRKIPHSSPTVSPNTLLSTTVQESLIHNGRGLMDET